MWKAVQMNTIFRTVLQGESHMK